MSPVSLVIPRLRAFRRRLFLGFERDDLVLDIGSGHKPHPRADILCERYLLDNRQRAGDVVRDRPLVIADATALPFRTKAFGYVVCQHVIEHIPDVAAALKEISRVGKRGYIETPSPLWEQLMGRDYHLWLVASEAGKLILRRKLDNALDRSTVRIFVGLAENSPAWNKVVLENFDLFYTTFKWENRIAYEIAGPTELPTDLEHTDDEEAWPARSRPLPWWEERLKRAAFSLLRRVLSTRHRNSLWEVLGCPACKSQVDRISQTEIVCRHCELVYPIHNDIPIMLIGEASRFLYSEKAPLLRDQE